MSLQLLSQKQHGSTANLILFYEKCSSESVSDSYNINSYAMVRFIFRIVDVEEIEFNISIKKHEKAMGVKVTMDVDIEDHQQLKEVPCTETWTTHYLDIQKCVECDRMFEVRVSLIVTKADDPFRINLYNDNQFIDLELCGEDGSIGIHKAIAAFHSDMLKSLFAGTWKESEEKSIKIKDVTRQTLQYLKDYMYLGIVPSDMLHLRSLLLLSRYYLMDDLEEKCIMQLIQGICPENLLELLDFSRGNNLLKLTFAILQFTPDSLIKCAYGLEIKK